MQPDETPRQPQALQPDAFPERPPAPPQPRPALAAGECGDPIWEYAAYPGETLDEALPAQQRQNDQAAPREDRLRAGRVIDLVERQARRGR
jgi:hypothetical protein